MYCRSILKCVARGVLNGAPVELARTSSCLVVELASSVDGKCARGRDLHRVYIFELMAPAYNAGCKLVVFLKSDS